MVSLSIRGMTGWVNPLRVAVRRPWTLFVARRRSGGAFFVETLRGLCPLGTSAWGGLHVEIRSLRKHTTSCFKGSKTFELSCHRHL
jgi:hypothetical protein